MVPGVRRPSAAQLSFTRLAPGHGALNSVTNNQRVRIKTRKVIGPPNGLVGVGSPGPPEHPRLGSGDCDRFKSSSYKMEARPGSRGRTAAQRSMAWGSLGPSPPTMGWILKMYGTSFIVINQLQNWIFRRDPRGARSPVGRPTSGRTRTVPRDPTLLQTIEIKGLSIPTCPGSPAVLGRPTFRRSRGSPGRSPPTGSCKRFLGSTLTIAAGLYIMTPTSERGKAHVRRRIRGSFARAS